ncbi:ankyrin repeat protein [Ectocarpus siliculosus]|uniref:Ankyrin repeat protein n=1 Tax=Ectocarpus siliculosus TaxID=2880 RepID=D7G1C5_ECTSI|nr:ankyrin repeat protein [Ectocarpus siliculosus]|eukprot:CBJ33235.1 ankyrin repeat protein [Ectocarpus siliculosus]
MGSAAGKLFRGGGTKIEFMESTKMPTAKDMDMRRRNSLMFFMRDWQESSTFEEQEASMLQIKKYHQMEAKVSQDDPILAKMNKIPLQISLGDMRLLRETVIMKWKDINRSYQGPLLGETVLHRVCREGYLGALKFMLDPNSKSIFETETVDPNILNKRKRTALMLCFTSPHFTEITKNFGLEQDTETGLGVPRPRRPDTAQGTIDLLLEHGIDPRQTCMTGETALHFAVSLRHGEAAEILLKRSQDLVNEADKDGDRAIHLAVQNGDHEIVNLLVDYQADINSPNYRRVTPLAVACKRQDWQMVNHLLDKKLARAVGDREADAARLKALKAYGQWVPYTDKMGGGIFYYNKVSRESRRQAPEDYVKDKEYVMKSATFGMHFYH